MPWPSSLGLPEPHDARLKEQQSSSSYGASATTTIAASSPAADASSPLTEIKSGMVSTIHHADVATDLKARSWNQLRLFLTGCVLTTFSVLLTRRSMTSKINAIRPSGPFTPSNSPLNFNGGAEAAEALGLATLNVGSIFLMLAGGALWAFDIDSPEELRASLRTQMRLDGPSAGEMASQSRGSRIRQEAQKEDDIAMWMDVMAARLQGKSEGEIAALVLQKEEEARGNNRESD